MSAKQLLRLGLVLLVLLLLWGGAALGRHRAATAGSGDAFRLPRIAGHSVDSILLARPGDTVVLARRDSSTWTVNGHPAAAQAVNDLLGALTDTTTGGELVAERRTSHASLGVDSAGTRVRVKGGVRTLADLVAGHRSPDFSGGYLRSADQDATYLVQGRLVEDLTRSGDDWRDHRIAAVTADSVGAIVVSRGSRRYELRRAGAGWTLSPGGPADSARAAELIAAYRDVEASGFATAAQADSAHFSPPDRRIQVLRKDGSPILTLVFDSTAAAVWVQPEGGKTIYRLDAYSAERLAPADTGLRAKKEVVGRKS
jgi:hypothetical protein